jgi:hypothetical protein
MRVRFGLRIRSRLALLGGASAMPIVLAATACTGISSVPPGGDGDSYTGAVYSLPTTRIPLIVSVNTTADQITIAAGEPLYIADEDHRYRLHLRQSIAHADIFNIAVGPNGLLTTADLRSDGRLDEAIIAAAKSVGAFESAMEERDGSQIVYATLIDAEALASPGDGMAPALAGLNQEINRVLKQRLTTANTSFLKAAAIVPQPNLYSCEARFSPASVATPCGRLHCRLLLPGPRHLCLRNSFF